MDFSFGLSTYGPEYAIIGIMASVIAYLYKKLMEAKDEQLTAAQNENERNELSRETLERTADNIFTFVESHINQATYKNRYQQKNKS